MSKISCKKCGHSFETFSSELSVDTYNCPQCGTNNAESDNLGSVPPPTESSLNVEPNQQAGSNQNKDRQICDWEENWKVDTLGAFIRTSKSILTDPTGYFGRINPIEDYLPLVIWVYVYMFINFFFTMMYQLVIGMVSKPEMLLGIPVMMCGVLIAPLLAIAFVFIVAAILHFFIVNIGGSTKRFNVTLTVYSLGTVTGVFAVIPLLGGLISLVYGIVVNIFGMANAHEISPSRMFLSLIVPIFIIACCIGSIVMLLGFTAGGLAGLLK